MQKDSDKKSSSARYIGTIFILIIVLISIIYHNVMTANVIGDSQVTNADNSNFPWNITLIVIGLFILVNFISNSIIHRIKSSKNDNRLKDFIRGCRQRGYKQEEILELLGQTGWHKEEVDKYF